MRHRILALILLTTVVVSAPFVAPGAGRAQTGAAFPVPDTLVVRADDAAPDPVVRLVAGERIAVWVESDVEVGDRGVGPGPVGEAAVGELIARFGASGAFAWPRRPTVWIAPAAGALSFDVNSYPAHRARGSAEVAVLRLGPLGSMPPVGFEAPILQLDRVEGGVRARWSDRAGFGVEPATLAIELTTSHGTLYRLGPWVRPGAREVMLPLPPPGLVLPPGIHTLTATIEDRLGTKSPPSTIRFDSP